MCCLNPFSPKYAPPQFTRVAGWFWNWEPEIRFHIWQLAPVECGPERRCLANALWGPAISLSGAVWDRLRVASAQASLSLSEVTYQGRGILSWWAQATSDHPTHLVLPRPSLSQRARAVHLIPLVILFVASVKNKLYMAQMVFSMLSDPTEGTNKW